MSVDCALERAAAAALRLRYEGLPGGLALERGGWVVLSWSQRAQAPWAHRVVAAGPVTGASLDAALAEVPGLPVVASLPAGALDDDELSRRGFGTPVPLVRLVAPAGGPPVLPDGLWLEMVGPQGGGEVSAVGRAGSGPDEPWWWVAPLGAAGWTQLVAYDGDTPVATGAVHVAGDVASLEGVEAVPGQRVRDAGTAVVRHLLHLAREQGALRVTATAEPGTTGQVDLVDGGFVPAYDVVRWSRAGSTTGGGAEAVPGQQT